MMKKLSTILLFFTAFIFTSCEEVINVKVDKAPPRLSIRASIEWEKGTPGNVQRIILTTTTGYFDSTIPVVSGAVVTVTNSENSVFNFIENPNTGIYLCTDFIPAINETYTLKIINNGETYTSTETMYAVAPINKMVQNNQGGITGKKIQVKTFYNDPPNEKNYYLYRYEYPTQLKSDLYTDEDSYFDGNEFFSLSQNDSLKVGKKIKITHVGISKGYYNYVSIVLNLAGQNSGGPFQSPPSTIRGNVVNTTNSANYPVGYFAVSESDVKEYTVQ